ncbi:hypothetical protein BN1326_130034 [Staphylococcus argenteus]|uniref:Uncharacterized protein n=1 Tax=Staphylococcus argenteus TaxID=985002 RepID=A0A7U7JQR6_9STAP|nr:hypothetical protein BN1326_130034 [Staphylococcus argenteus]CRI13328.1 hypothetical protein BN1326_130034 [Staphylococcus argenteus]
MAKRYKLKYQRFTKRIFPPKKTDLAKVNQEQLNYVLCSINYRPRKCLE